MTRKYCHLCRTIFLPLWVWEVILTGSFWNDNNLDLPMHHVIIRWSWGHCWKMCQHFAIVITSKYWNKVCSQHCQKLLNLTMTKNLFLGPPKTNMQSKTYFRIYLWCRNMSQLDGVEDTAKTWVDILSMSILPSSETRYVVNTVKNCSTLWPLKTFFLDHPRQICGQKHILEFTYDAASCHN